MMRTEIVGVSLIRHGTVFRLDNESFPCWIFFLFLSPLVPDGNLLVHEHVSKVANEFLAGELGWSFSGQREAEGEIIFLFRRVPRKSHIDFCNGGERRRTV